MNKYIINIDDGNKLQPFYLFAENMKEAIKICNNRLLVNYKLIEIKH